MEKHKIDIEDAKWHLTSDQWALIVVIIFAMLSVSALLIAIAIYKWGIAFAIAFVLIIVFLCIIEPIIRAFQNSNYTSTQKAINEKARKILTNNQIKYDLVLHIKDVHTLDNKEGNLFIALDRKNKKIIIPDYGDLVLYVCDFSEISSCGLSGDIRPTKRRLFVPTETGVAIPISTSGPNICKTLLFSIKIKEKKEEIIFPVIFDYIGGIKIDGRKFNTIYESVNVVERYIKKITGEKK